MKKLFTILSAAAVVLGIASCASSDKMAQLSQQVSVKCNPSPLAVKAGKVSAELAVFYPNKYFSPKAILEVTPVIVYEGGEEVIDPLMYQGEKIKNNYKVVAAEGGVVNETVVFPYREGMAKCHLELRARCTVNEGKKWVTLPTKKVADGCNITETLVNRNGIFDFKQHNYKAVVILNPEGQVLYNINSANVRKSEIKGKSVKSFQQALKDIANDDRKVLRSIEVVAYASPDGPEAKNITLSDNRSKSADKAFQGVAAMDELKGIPTAVKSVGEDWEGFQKMVSNSSIEDKELILRVLNMYKDPNVREQEIRNMSAVYQDLAKDVLPQLRRARFIANVAYTNFTDEELLALIKENSDELDEESLLKAATLCSSNADKKALYDKAVEKYNSERAQYNLVCLAVCENDIAKAKTLIEKCDFSDIDVINLAGVIALRDKDLVSAKKCFEMSGSAAAKQNLAILYILEGDYRTAVIKGGNSGTESALANVLYGDPAQALKCLGDCQCAKAQYIRAICYARQGKNGDARVCLDKAGKADSYYAKRAKTDIEFANL